MTTKKIKIGFIINYRLEGWLGVTNYYSNLIKEVSKEDKNIEIIILTDFFFTKKEEKKFKGYRIIKSDLFNRKSKFKKIYNLLSITFFGRNLLIENFLKENEISIISHTNYLGKNSKIPSIKWFPDFQEIKYPQNFNFKQKLARKFDIYLSCKHSNKILLSSKSVKKYLKKINTDAYNKSIVLYHTTNIDGIKISNFDRIKKKYDLKKKFFYLPNHFWKHKNHIVVYKAINYLKKSNIEVCLIATGSSKDYRFPKHFFELNSFIKKHNLENNIRILGIVPLNDVYSLIKNSLAVINPSLFEGWGNTLEHAIKLNKIAIVSNIDVHRERSSKNKILFNPNNYKDLAKVMMKIIRKPKGIKKLNKHVHENEFNSFGKNYIKIIKNILNL